MFEERLSHDNFLFLTAIKNYLYILKKWLLWKLRNKNDFKLL